jgi:hypothetical protein
MTGRDLVEPPLEIHVYGKKGLDYYSWTQNVPAPSSGYHKFLVMLKKDVLREAKPLRAPN